MIKIAIHGTKGGFHPIYGESISFYDPSADTTNWKAIGQTAYSLMFVNNSCVFSKYKIIRDVLGDKRQGTIAFSVIIPNRYKLQGADVKSLVDRICDDYCHKYLKGNNLDDVREDWSFINLIVAPYKSKLTEKPDVEKIQQGAKESAFIYYPYVCRDTQTGKDTTYEIEEIFDRPYQDKYSEFKRIFFIDSKLKGEEANPLTSLRNSVEELKINLGNEYFYLTNYDRNRGVNIIVNGIPFDNKNNNFIEKEWQIEIKYSKEYHYPIEATGKLSKRNSEISEYLVVNSNQVKIKYDAFNLKHKNKFVEIIARDKDTGRRVNNFTLLCWTHNYNHRYNNQKRNRIEFFGEEIAQIWEISLEKRGIYSNKIRYCPTEGLDKITLYFSSHGLFPKWIWLTLAGFLIPFIIFIIFSLIYSFSDSSGHHRNITRETITDYTKGIELDDALLQDYEKRWNAQRAKATNFLNILWRVNSDYKSTQQQYTGEIHKQIKIARDILKNINEGLINSLKNYDYSYNQKVFKEAINKIEDDGVVDISERMMKMQKDKQSANLMELANSINIWVENINNSKQKQNTTHNYNGYRSNTNASVIRDNESLEKEFFELIKRGENQKDPYTDLYKKYEGETGEVISFLKEITKNTIDFNNKFKDRFRYISLIERQQISSITELKDKLQ